MHLPDPYRLCRFPTNTSAYCDAEYVSYSPPSEDANALEAPGEELETGCVTMELQADVLTPADDERPWDAQQHAAPCWSLTSQMPAAAAFQPPFPGVYPPGSFLSNGHPHDAARYIEEPDHNLYEFDFDDQQQEYLDYCHEEYDSDYSPGNEDYLSDDAEEDDANELSSSDDIPSEMKDFIVSDNELIQDGPSSSSVESADSSE